MNDFADGVAADRRLRILGVLAQADNHCASSRILRTGLARYRFTPSLGALASELTWLEEQGLVTLEHLKDDGETLLIATLTRHGRDVQMGRTAVPGVADPTSLD